MAKRIGFVIASLIAAFVLLLVLIYQWEYRAASSGLGIAICDIATDGAVVSENIEFVGDIDVSDFSTDYEILQFDNILFWGYSFDVKFSGGTQYQFDVFPSPHKETTVRAQPVISKLAD